MAMAKTMASLFMVWHSSVVRMPGLDTPIKTSAPARASFRPPLIWRGLVTSPSQFLWASALLQPLYRVTGRSDFPNQVNNVLCFPGLFKGALSVRARDINDAMKLAAAYAIADLITDEDRSEENIIPGAFDPRVAEAVASAVAKAARESGVARL